MYTNSITGAYKYSMRSFEFVEDKINYNFLNQHWQIRSDDPTHRFKTEQPRVVVKDAVPYVDYDAHDAGKKIYAYIQGDVVRGTPNTRGYQARPIKFVRDNTHTPFVHTDDGSRFERADYVVFDGRQIMAYYKT